MLMVGHAFVNCRHMWWDPGCRIAITGYVGSRSLALVGQLEPGTGVLWSSWIVLGTASYNMHRQCTTCPKAWKQDGRFKFPEKKWVRYWQALSDRRVRTESVPAYRCCHHPILYVSPFPIECMCIAFVVLITGHLG
jgi:hypothetical protein